MHGAWLSCTLIALVAPEGTAADKPGNSEGAVADDYAQAPPMDDLVQQTSTAAADAPAAPDTSDQRSTGTSVNGYIDSRTTFQRANVGGLVSTRQLPQLNELLEGNVQLKHNYVEQGFVYADASAFGQFAGWYRTADATGNEIAVGDQNLPQYQPLFSLNEFYVSHDILPQLNVTFGKKRMVWGPGFAFNPTDLMDPPKDPTNPSFQRAGFWMGRLEANFGTAAFTVVAAPAVTEQAAGIPFAFVKYPTWDRQDDQAHFQLAARAYVLVVDADINVMFFYGNRYHDAFTDKWRVGASFSRYFFTDYEFHAEALVQTGSAVSYPNSACLTSERTALQCVAHRTPLLQTSRLHDAALFAKLLVGTRRQFADESIATVEYYYQGDGYTQKQFQQLIDVLELQNLAASAPVSSDGSSGIPQNYTFNPSGRHYLIASYAKPKMFEDFTATLVLIASLSDLSTFIAPSLAWNVREWITLTLYGFVPAPGPTSMAVLTANGKYVSEFTTGNSDYRLLLEARLFY